MRVKKMDLQTLWAQLPRELKGCVGFYLRKRLLIIKRLDGSVGTMMIDAHAPDFIDMEALRYCCLLLFNVSPIDVRLVHEGRQLNDDEARVLRTWREGDILYLVTFDEVNEFPRGHR